MSGDQNTGAPQTYHKVSMDWKLVVSVMTALFLNAFAVGYWAARSDFNIDINKEAINELKLDGKDIRAEVKQEVIRITVLETKWSIIERLLIDLQGSVDRINKRLDEERKAELDGRPTNRTPK